MKKTQTLILEHYLGSDSMNFREFEELINSGADEITLTEDVILEDGEEEKYEEGIEIIKNNLIIDGDNHAIDGCMKVPLLIINASNIILKNILFKNSYCEYSGAAVDNRDNLTIEDCRFVDNSSDEYGGAIYSASNSKLSIRKSIFKKNRADYGGAIYMDSDSVLNLDGSLFESNSSEFEGGAIYNKSRLLIYGSLFDKNTSFKGGAIYNEYVLNVKSSEFRNNIASDGNHIESENEENLSISDCNFRG